MTKTLWIVALVLVVMLVCAGIGYVGRGAATAGNEVKAIQQAQKTSERKQRAGLAAGVRTEQAQAATNTYFDQLHTAYETDQQQHPGIGCVLDPVSLRRWNDANAQSSDGAASEFNDTVPDAPGAAAGTERSE